MAITLSPTHLGRYRDLARLLLKYGRSDIVRNAGLAETLRDDQALDEAAVPAEAAELASDLEQLGPTFIKLGQVLSTRADIFPPSYLEALSRLQDDVEPFPFDEVEQVLEAELTARPSKAFEFFDPEPLAAASLGQVHRATLRDGREVVVKVQRPGIRPRIREDMEALEEIATLLDAHTTTGRRYHFVDLIEEFRRTIARELDYRREAANLNLLRANLREFERIVVPTPIDDYTTSRILTMERVHGRNVSRLNRVAMLELDGDDLCDELFRAYLKQILVDGTFHADPHPGNVLVTDDHRLALIDLGMTGHVAPAIQEKLLRMLIAIADGDGDEVARIALDIGEHEEDTDKGAFTREVGELVASNKDQSIGETDVGRMVMEITGIAGRRGIRQPPELALLGRALLNLHQVASILAPGFNPSDAIRRHTAEIMRRKLLKAASPASIFSNILEVNEFVQRLPARVNRLFDRVADDDFQIRVRAIDEARLISGLEKIANRITLGLVLAALIVSAAMLVRVESGWRIFGYPALPILLYLGAAVGGMLLIRSILAHDEKVEKKR